LKDKLLDMFLGNGKMQTRTMTSIGLEVS